ncbi:hypothetical protein NJ76_23060, partial [Rhodococcus sp. IITR03]
ARRPAWAASASARGVRAADPMEGDARAAAGSGLPGVSDAVCVDCVLTVPWDAVAPAGAPVVSELVAV